jgi:hypothetical protein
MGGACATCGTVTEPMKEDGGCGIARAGVPVNASRVIAAAGREMCQRTMAEPRIT